MMAIHLGLRLAQNRIDAAGAATGDTSALGRSEPVITSAVVMNNRISGKSTPAPACRPTCSVPSFTTLLTRSHESKIGATFSTASLGDSKHSQWTPSKHQKVR